MSNGTVPEKQLQEIFNKLVEYERVDFGKMKERAWQIFKNYGALHRFDAFNAMMIASQQFGDIKLELIILKLEVHHKAVISSLMDKGRFHDDISPNDIKHSLMSNSTQEVFRNIFTDLGVRKMHPDIVHAPQADEKN